MRNPAFKARSLVPFLIAISLLTPSTIASVWDNPATGDWFDPANWIGAVPDATTSAIFINGGTAVADPLSPLFPGGVDV
ncbi:MAG: hypothetical protein ACYTGQ_00975 [Planctomycetota bacterium]|jgi:hypothetical protein